MSKKLIGLDAVFKSWTTTSFRKKVLLSELA